MSNPFTVTPGAQRMRLVVFALLSLLTTGFGVYLMYQILSANDLKPLEAVILVFFAVSFGWISMAFWSAFFGFVLQLAKRDPISFKRRQPLPSDRPLAHRYAVIMPIYNEDTQRIIAGFEATFRSLMALPQGPQWDFFILSDTTDLSIAGRERQAFAALRSRLGPLAEHTFYRRRDKNTGRKVGNLADFCENFGSQYHGMVVLDADSVMTGDCIMTLALSLETNPKAGLIQTVPIPVRQTTFFGRFVQYAAALYSPMLATGITFWQTDACNYWGHNAMIRLQAFMDHCGLPSLPGKAPFGGDILSHDFVEAALLRRAGWDVLLLPDLAGSYEEVPCNIIDFAKRDRRWVQGNIQHLGLLGLKDLHPVSRVHFISGALAYISSLVWLAMLSLSTCDAVIRALNANVYFTNQYQLFPDWPIAKTGLIMSMIALTLTLLLGPKMMGLVVALCRYNREFGGSFRLLKGALLEALVAIVIAPIMMCFHAFFVVSVFLGFKVSWDAQAREGRLLPWREVIARTRTIALGAAVWGGMVWYYAPAFFIWVAPVVLGLVLSPWLVRYSSSLNLGHRTKTGGFFITPTDTQPPAVLTQLEQLLHQGNSLPPLDTVPQAWLPQATPRPMQHGDLNHYQLRETMMQGISPTG